MTTAPNPITQAADILVVDDTIESLSLLTGLLTDAGYRVRPADGPQVALDSAIAHPPGLILLDVRMPGMDGFEVCRRMKQDSRTADVPVIFVSALQDTAERVQGFEAGGVDFISKPFQASEVLARVKTHLRLRAFQLHLEIMVAEQTAGLQEANAALKREIAEHERTEAFLRESEERFRALMEQSPLSTQIFRDDGQVIQVNKAWQALWGISEEVLPEVIDKYNVLEDGEAKAMGILPFIEKAFNGEDVVLPVIEYDASSTLEDMEVGGAEGKKCLVQARFYPVKNSSGEVVNVVGTEEDVTERKLAEEKVQQYQQRLKALASQLTIAEEKERRTIAADLHDHVGHSLALARMQLKSIQESASELERNILIKDVSKILLQALQNTRNLIFELSSPSMNEIGLGAAISEWLEDHIVHRSGLEIEVVDAIAPEHRKSLDENARALLFRNVRELLTNVVKHARAKKVRVHLKEDDRVITIIVDDDGVGFDPEQGTKQRGQMGGFGLFSIQERMTDMGGSFDVESEPGKGCRVELRLPVKKGEG